MTTSHSHSVDPFLTERIASLFLRGFSLDLISELGVTYRWTRADAQAVCHARGWALDWSGRLQQLSLSQARFTTVAPRCMPNLSDATAEQMIEVGGDHRSATVRLAAERAGFAVLALRTELARQEGLARSRTGRHKQDGPPEAQNGSGAPVGASRALAHGGKS